MIGAGRSNTVRITQASRGWHCARLGALAECGLAGTGADWFAAFKGPAPNRIGDALCEARGGRMLLRFPLITALAAASVHSQANSQSPLIVINVGSLRSLEVGVLDPSGRFVLLHASDVSCGGTMIERQLVEIHPERAVGVYREGSKKGGMSRCLQAHGCI